MECAFWLLLGVTGFIGLALLLAGFFSKHWLADHFLRTSFLPFDGHDSKESKDALAWNDALEHPERFIDGSTDFTVELEYAYRRLDVMNDTFTQLDSKLETLMRFGGTFVGGVAGFMKLSNTPPSPLAAISIGFLLFGVSIAVWGRISVKKARPISVRSLMNYSCGDPPPDNHQVRACLAASIHVTVETIVSTNSWKSAQYSRASLFVLAGLVSTTCWIASLTW